MHLKFGYFVLYALIYRLTERKKHVFMYKTIFPNNSFAKLRRKLQTLKHIFTLGNCTVYVCPSFNSITLFKDGDPESSKRRSTLRLFL